MYIVKVLKRRDASSVIVAIVLAFIVINVLQFMTGNLAGIIAGADDGYYMGSGFPGASWRNTYLQPIVAAILQVIIVEVGIRLVVLFRRVFVRRVK